MSNNIYRCFVEKRPGFDVAAKSIQNELAEVLGLQDITIRLLNRTMFKVFRRIDGLILSILY